MLHLNKRTLLSCLGATAALFFTPSVARAQFFVDPGYDLFSTMSSGTMFNGVHYEGVPLGTFDFGSGAVGVGNTDTIIQRTQQVSAAGGGSGTTNLVVRALQLESVGPVNGHLLFATLDTSDPTKNQGQMTINFNSAGTGGTFNSFFDVFFDIHVDSLNGAIVAQDDINLSSNGSLWDRTPTPGAVIIDGVNHDLDKTDTTHDFWPGGNPNDPRGPGQPVIEDSSGAAHHQVITSTPEVGTFLQLGSLVVLSGGFLLRRRRS